mmetsp:Transcript_29123/g.38302  ORF Transcript_29123/g.38302 Transcript_29123/m.38302 type:complete len:626 (+) Transcript_29123:45-1922(+)
MDENGNINPANGQDDIAIELEHAIGFSAVKGALFFHPNGRDYVYPAGGTIVVADLHDPHNQVFLHGHDEPIYCMDLSSSGQYIASGQLGTNADAVIWHFETRQLMYRFQEHDFGVVSVAFSEDEKLVCTVGLNEDNKVMVWDMSNGYIVAIVGHNPSPTSVACFGGFVKDIKRRDTQNYLIATAGTKSVVLWDLNAYTGEMVGERVVYEGRGSMVREFTWLQFSPDKSTIFCGTTSGDFLLVNVKARTIGNAITACHLGVGHLITCPEGLLAGGGDGTVTLFNQQLVDTAQVRLEGPVNAVALSPDGREILASTAAGRVYRASTSQLNQPVLLNENPYGAVKAVAYAENISDRFATASTDLIVRLWDASDYSVICQAMVKDAGEPRCLTLNEDLILSGWQDGRVRAHDIDNGKQLWLIENCHRGGVTALLLSHNQRFVVSGGEEGEVRVWELRSRELVSHLKEHSLRITGLALYQDDCHLLSCSRDRCFLCWDLRSERRMTCHTQRMGGINSVALSKDETCVVTVGQEKRLTFWDLRDPNPVHLQDLTPNLRDEAMCVAVASNGKVVATAGSDQVVRLWDFAKCTLLSEGTGHSGTINELRFSPDDRQLVSVGEDGNIFVWNVYS